MGMDEDRYKYRESRESTCIHCLPCNHHHAILAQPAQIPKVSLQLRLEFIE